MVLSCFMTDFLSAINYQPKFKEEKENDMVSFVSNPEKQVSTLESYISYEIRTKTSRADFPAPEVTARRRYTDFEWLKKKLEELFPGSIVPPLPEKFVIRGVLERFEVRN